LSSILEALKKVEKESHQLDFTPDITKGVDARKAVSRRARGARIANRIVTSMVVLIVLGLGSWFALAHRDLFRKSGIEHKTAPTVMQEAPPVTTSVNFPPAEPPAIEKTVEAPKEKPSSTPDANRARAGKQEVHAVQPISKEEFTSTPPLKIQPSKELRESDPDDAKFKLEAIVWSESPASRFAVINGQIIRAGGSMEGISITAIARDHVGVRSSGREWKLMFVAE
jgi:hypothetical protein